jgi:exosortase
MIPVAQKEAAARPAVRSWLPVLWFGGLLILCYLPVLRFLVYHWQIDEDMGHGFFVPVIAGYIVWQKRDGLRALRPQPSWWGLIIIVWSALQLIVATLGSELFLARTAFVFSVIGSVLFLGGMPFVRALAMPLFLLFFMIPIPGILYNRITFPLQLLASRVAESSLLFLDIPVLREGNVLELANQRLSVVEACSGIRSLLSLTFLSLVYGHFFERRIWVRSVLFLSTIPIAIVANAGRVTLTGILTQHDPALAEGFLHTASGWVIFMVALVIMVGLHQALTKLHATIQKARALGPLSS